MRRDLHGWGFRQAQRYEHYVRSLDARSSPVRSHLRLITREHGPRCSKAVAVWHRRCRTRVMADDDTDFTPGDGPSSGTSVSLTAGTLQAIRERVGKRGVSAYLEKAAQRQIERDNLDSLIVDFAQANGPADPEPWPPSGPSSSGPPPLPAPGRSRDRRPRPRQREPGQGRSARPRGPRVAHRRPRPHHGREGLASPPHIGLHPDLPNTKCLVRADDQPVAVCTRGAAWAFGRCFGV